MANKMFYQYSEEIKEKLEEIKSLFLEGAEVSKKPVSSFNETMVQMRELFLIYQKIEYRQNEMTEIVNQKISA